jgi:ATP-dependent Clp protease ATP-binding subunit ClpX
VLAGLKRPKLDDWGSLSEAELLRALPASAAQVESRRDVLQTQIDILRKRGVSWAAIGGALGVSRRRRGSGFS